MKSAEKKLVFAAWYFVLVAVCVWRLYEFSYPAFDYSSGPWLQTFFNYSALILVATAVPFLLLLYKGKRAVVFLAVLVAASVLLAGFLAPDISASARNKTLMQGYIDDLKSHGFNVVYSAQYPYFHGPETTLDSYAQVINIAKNLNCTTIYIHNATPEWFVFRFPSEIVLTFFVFNEGYYMYNIEMGSQFKSV